MSLIRLCLVALLLVVAGMTAPRGMAQEAMPVAEPTGLPSAEDVAIGREALEILLVPLTGSDLAELAAVWQEHLKATLRTSSELKLKILTVSPEDEAPVREQLATQSELQKEVIGKYSSVLKAWASKGGSDEELNPHKTYLNALTVAAVKTTDAKTLFAAALDWALSAEGGLGLVLRIFGFLIAVWGLLIFAGFIRRATQRGLNNVPNISRLFRSFIVTAVYWLSFILGVLIVLALFGVNVTPMFAVFGGVSFILGFALQETLGNLASGLMIMVLKPFDTGDYIQVAGASGTVDEMSVVSTRIRTFDNQVIVVPNSKIWGDVITNVNASPERRVDLVFGIGYSDDAHRAIAVLTQLVEAHPLCLKDPLPEIFVGELADSSVNIFCRPWSRSDDYWTVYWELTGQAKERFDAEGISIPFPQRDVHLIQG